MNIFDRLKNGETVSYADPHYKEILQVAAKTRKLVLKLNNTQNNDEFRAVWEEVTGKLLDESTAVFLPFQINIGNSTSIGKNVFINHDCTFLDMGGITIEDEVLIGPKVSLITEGHPINPEERKALYAQPIVIKKNAWIGAGATILPGVSIGCNSVVAAGAVVNKEVPDNVVVGGVPAKIIKRIT